MISTDYNIKNLIVEIEERDSDIKYLTQVLRRN
jgi:hypothetical protein